MVFNLEFVKNMWNVTGEGLSNFILNFCSLDSYREKLTWLELLSFPKLKEYVISTSYMQFWLEYGPIYSAKQKPLTIVVCKGY